VVAADSKNEKRVRAGSLVIGLAVMLQKPEQRCRLQEIQEVFDQVNAVYLDTSNTVPLREVCTKQVQKDEDPHQSSKVPKESQSRSSIDWQLSYRQRLGASQANVPANIYHHRQVVYLSHRPVVICLLTYEGSDAKAWSGFDALKSWSGVDAVRLCGRAAKSFPACRKDQCVAYGLRDVILPFMWIVSFVT
jgi:hypothetical protein